MANTIAKLAPLPMQFSKKMLSQGINNNLAAQLEYEVFVTNYLLGTRDHEEAVRAFLEKREPSFEGRQQHS